MMLKKYLLVIVAYIITLLIITATTFVVVKIFSPFIIATIMENFEWLPQHSLKAIRIIIIAAIYIAVIICYSIVFFKTSIGLKALNWFIVVNKNVGLTFIKESNK